MPIKNITLFLSNIKIFLGYFRNDLQLKNKIIFGPDLAIIRLTSIFKINKLIEAGSSWKKKVGGGTEK